MLFYLFHAKYFLYWFLDLIYSNFLVINFFFHFILYLYYVHVCLWLETWLWLSFRLGVWKKSISFSYTIYVYILIYKYFINFRYSVYGTKYSTESLLAFCVCTRDSRNVLLRAIQVYSHLVLYVATRVSHKTTA